MIGKLSSVGVMFGAYLVGLTSYLVGLVVDMIDMVGLFGLLG